MTQPTWTFGGASFFCFKLDLELTDMLGNKGGAVVRASNPSVDAICGLSLLLVLSLASRGFSLGTSAFPTPKKHRHFQNPTRSGTHGHVEASSL